jgi:hypothetical protein
MFAVEILEGIDGEAKFSNRKDEHYAEEYTVMGVFVSA